MKIKPKIVKVELAKPVEFEWDEGNVTKNLVKHKVSPQEAEQIFDDPDKQIFKDIMHSQKESRLLVIGQTHKKRILYIVFTLRKKQVRVISARDLNKKEGYLYP